MGMKDNSSHMRSLDGKVHRMRQELAQTEISFFDVVKAPEYVNWEREQEYPDDCFEDLNHSKYFITKGFLRPPKQLLDAILYSYGMDIDKPVKAVVCKHRSFDGSVHVGVRYIGRTRTDSHWKLFMMDNLGVRL